MKFGWHKLLIKMCTYMFSRHKENIITFYTDGILESLNLNSCWKIVFILDTIVIDSLFSWIQINSLCLVVRTPMIFAKTALQHAPNNLTHRTLDQQLVNCLKWWNSRSPGTTSPHIYGQNTFLRLLRDLCHRTAPLTYYMLNFPETTWG